MKQSEDLRRLLESIDRKSYPAYKSAQGLYRFDRYTLSIDHVQGDPFASPSKVSVTVPHARNGFPPSLYQTPWRKVAFEDHLVRRFAQEIARFNFKAKGSGKSGLIAISVPGPEILSRTACSCTQSGITARFEVGFPANGRTINSRELIRILFDFLPRCVENVFLYESHPAGQLQAVADLADDQHFIRQELKARDLAAFVADGSILPRESGVSSRPMKHSVPFCSPDSLKISMDLPHRGRITGMGIRRGITLVVGGGYHGKSTLLKALELGVYNHIAGDGREYVITDHTALKLRAEDGRSIRSVDISLFIRDLPSKKDTACFSTADASGSTSQAAAVMEGLEAGSQVFLIDEDTSATNFMLRDQLMQQVISRDKEPITPFIERARQLFDQAGVSTIMVAGSSGAYFYIADTVIQMDCYRPVDITDKVRRICREYGQDPGINPPAFALPAPGRKLLNQEASPSSGHGFQREKEDRIKVKVYGRDSFQVGRETVDLRFVEQLVHPEQTAALAQMLRWCLEKQLLSRYPVTQVVEMIRKEIEQKGLWAVGQSSFPAMGLCMPRPQEIFACLNRWRG